MIGAPFPVRPTCLEIENFRGFRGDCSLDFGQDLTLLMGECKAGKSSILTAIEWCLLGTMVESGVPLQTGLRLTRSSFGNSALQGLFQTLEDVVVNGRGLSSSLFSCSFVPSAAAQMVATAERTGKA